MATAESCRKMRLDPAGSGTRGATHPTYHICFLLAMWKNHIAFIFLYFHSGIRYDKSCSSDDQARFRCLN